MPHSPERIVAATDGSCNPNPGPCAWAYVIADAHGRPARTASGGLGHGTNQVAELAAVLAVLEDTSGPITVYADSKYAINCLTTWLPAWRRNGWLNSSKKPVANRHYIERAAARMEGRDVRLEWVRGHNGHPLNEAADQAANSALDLPDKRGLSAPAGAAVPEGPSPVPQGALTDGAGGPAHTGAEPGESRTARPESAGPLPSPAPRVELAPRSPDWPPERGRSGHCSDCGDHVQQYPVAGRWVVLDAGLAPARMVPSAHRWRVDDDGLAQSPPPPHPADEGVRTRHVDVCPGRPGGLTDWATSLRGLRDARHDATDPGRG